MTACQKVNPELVMINEGRNPEWLEKAFDACYGWPWSYSIRNFLTPEVPRQKNIKIKTLAEMMAGVREYEAKLPADALMFVFMDNHDTAADDWEYRFDRVHPVEAGNAAFVLTFLRRGLPLVFNGNEIADNSLNTFFAPVEDVARARKTVDWARALQPAGQQRLALIRALADLRHRDALFQDAPMAWVTDGEAQGVVAFTRSVGGRRAFVAANLTDKPVAFTPSGVSLDPARKPILAARFSLDASGVHLGPWGYIVVECP